MDVYLLKPGDRVKYKLADNYHPSNPNRWKHGVFVRRVKERHEFGGNMVMVLFDGNLGPCQCTANVLSPEAPSE